MLDKSKELFALFQKYQAVDYWGYAAIIEGKKRARDEAMDRLRLVASPDTFPSDEDIEEFYYYHALSYVHEQFAEIGWAVREKKVAWLAANLRYDQPLSLDIYEVATGRKVRGLSNGKLRAVFSENLEEG